MSTDPATLVAGVPVKISEKFRPPRKISLPASCQHQINSDLLTQEYDFAVEKTTIQWVLERRNRIEKEERKRRERIAKYEQKKAEIKAKEEEEERLRKEKEDMIKQEKEKERLKKEEEEKSRLEEEEEIRRLEEVNQEEQTQETEKTNEVDAEEVTATTNTSQMGEINGESTPSHSSSSGAAGSTTGSLRSCRSVPDLTAAEDSEVTKYSSGLQSQSESRGVSHTPPPRPSSTGLTGLEDWKPLPDISGLSETSSSQHLYQSSSVQHPAISSPHTPIKSRLPDPFGELTTDAQALVQNMAEMGFPRSRVARAVQKLGTDHKKLIEVLLELQSLQGNGEDGYKAERAFYHYMGDIQKTKDHLAAAKQLLGLGFEEEQIVDALLRHDNDRDKALEELIA
ncbi:ubiquitin-associated protein 1-like isoform X2 [Scylla paramamosain]|uniref:ubiquitin-associated protein 1-like isoform X2 n=1 Tax=Scylla paramamosain TaxID=85552 RepID=UPI003083ACA8